MVRNGGSDHQIAPSKRVNIHTLKGLLLEYSLAIHLHKSDEKSPKLDNIL
jgi:putative aminopeptidase FrvX